MSWKKWGPYLSERQWGTVREDYSDNRDAWNYFSHNQPRSRADRGREGTYADQTALVAVVKEGRAESLIEED
jgi:hypothetical protein